MDFPRFEQARIAISAESYGGFGWVDGMTLPCFWREHAALSVTDEAVDGTVVRIIWHVRPPT
jgi:hypothetical protein